LQTFIDKIEKGELKDFVLDTLLPNREIDTIYFLNPLDLFISFEVKTSETDPFSIKDVGICDLTVRGVVAMDFKEKWVLSSNGFAKKITEFALVFEVILVTLPDQYFEDQYMYVIFWIKPE